MMCGMEHPKEEQNMSEGETKHSTVELIHKTPASKKKHVEEEFKPRGFGRGLEPERILECIISNNELAFIMKWKGSEETDIVRAVHANILCPQTVIAFYEERIVWVDED